MIQAVIFDCFGVLTSDAWLPFKRRYFGHDPNLEQQATDLNKQVDAGLADYDDFINGIAELAGMQPTQARAEIANNVANEALFEYMAQFLKPQYKIGLLSNAGANWLDELFGEKQAGLFDAVQLSCDTGFVKPDARAYHGVADALGVAPEACIFIDDQERYCTGARDVGMQAVVYHEFEQCRDELEGLLGRSSPR
ncbi:MAG TPA: HAD-IA family hydrolase [Candidatus Saccharimonadales bacterium]